MIQNLIIIIDMALTQRQNSLPSHAYARLHLPSHVTKLGAALLDQQMWCWGVDVRRAGGNLLIEYGFTRHSPPHKSRAASLYQFVFGDGAHSRLWASAILYSTPAQDHGDIVLTRGGFTPCVVLYTPSEGHWYPPPRGHTPCTPPECQLAHAALCAVLDWIAAYERWVTHTLGIAYRETSITGWPKAKRAPARGAEMAEAWAWLAETCVQAEIRTHYPGR
jgi:hypothetical protein